MLTDEGDISNYLEVNIKKNYDGTFELSQLHLVEKIINRVGLTVSVILKSIETPDGNHYFINMNLVNKGSVYGITGQRLVC